ncbi:hypothetical protein BDV12DRAFT_202349 [Aspergillus spectabilis]
MRGNTPLMLAVEIENYGIIEYLLQHGAAASIQLANHNGDSAIDLTEDDDILEFLNQYMEGNLDDSDAGGDDFGPGIPEPDGNI